MRQRSMITIKINGTYETPQFTTQSVYHRNLITLVKESQSARACTTSCWRVLCKGWFKLTSVADNQPGRFQGHERKMSGKY